MRRIWVAALAVAFLVGALAPASGQVGSVAPVTPSKSGMVSYIQGAVYADDTLIPDPIVAQFPYMKEGGTLRTTEGRAEVVMNPGLMMRVGENSTLRMITNRFIDTRVELVQGAATVQLLEVDKDNSFTLVCKDATVVVAKAGFYHFYAEPAGVKVFAGEARVQMGDQNIEVSAGKMLEFGGGKASVQKFDKDSTDALDRWSGRRGELVSAANASAARDCDNGFTTLGPRGFAAGGPASSYVNGNPCRGNWNWNPYYSMWTYIPYMNRYCDPMWGYCYYNPIGVWNYYYRPQPVYTNVGGGGMPSTGTPSYQSMGPTSSGNSGAVAASSAAMSAPGAGSGSSAAAAAASSEVGRGSAAGAGHGK